MPTVGILLSLVEDLSTAVTLTVDDTVGVSLADACLLMAPLSVQDGLALGCTDGTPTTPATIQVMESVAVPASETASVALSSLATFDVLETVSMTGTEQLGSLSGTLSVNDTLPLSMSEAPSIFGYVPQQFVEVTSTDTLEIHLGEQPIVPVPVSVTDAWALILADVGTSTFDFTITQSVTDSLRVQGTEAVTSTVLLRLTTTDTLSMTAVEPADPFTRLGVLDTPPMGLTEGLSANVSGFFTYYATDSVRVSGTDSAPVFPASQTVSTTEVLSVSGEDTLSLLSRVAALSDALSLSTNDAASLVSKFITLTDALGMPLDDAASLFDTFIYLAATENLGVGATDTINFLQAVLTQLATSDTVAGAVSEDVQTLTSEAGAQDAVTVACAELLSATYAVLAEDAGAVRIDAENANVVNPFVVFASISVADETHLEVTEEMPVQRLGLTVAEDCLLDAYDVALTEDLALPDRWEGSLATDYAMMQPDPISYRIGSKLVW